MCVHAHAWGRCSCLCMCVCASVLNLAVHMEARGGVGCLLYCSQYCSVCETDSCWSWNISLALPCHFYWFFLTLLCISNCLLKSDWVCINSRVWKCLHRRHLKLNRTLPSHRETWDHLSQSWKKAPALQGSRNQHQKLVHFLFILTPGYNPFEVLGSVRQPFGSASCFV